MSLVKKVLVQKKIEFEVWVRICCPYCASNLGTKKGKRILITIPARGLPDKVQCFNCEGLIDTKGLFVKGKEVQALASNGEVIKGVIC